ncbi:excinuclease ABC subunit UvrC [Bdellovibrionota bacterium FG-1]
MENQQSSVLTAHLSALRAELLVKAKDTTTSPGVYLMKDASGIIVYVGKAKNLTNRVSQYFQPAPHLIPRTEMMVNRVDRFEVILTGTEAEALILEATLIKKHKPKFNVRLKDDKAYPYLKIQVQDSYPRIEWTRRPQNDGARYFGPFPSAWSARQVMELLNETFKLRDCSDNTFRHRSRPCILFQIGKCSGACVRQVSESDYQEAIAKVVGILEGKPDQMDRLVHELRQGMEDAAEHEEYELAAEYRDQIRNLMIVTETQAVDEAGSRRDRDVMALARQGDFAHGTLLRVRQGRMVAVQHFQLQNTDPSLTDAAVLSEFVSQYYASIAEGGGEDASLPPEVLVPMAPDESEWFERTFGVALKVAENPKDEQLLQVAQANARYALEQALKKAEGHGLVALQEVQEKLHLPQFPHRIECYDISNTQGEESVASRVVFIDGAPDKNLYRRYKIKTVQGSNDFAMMREVLDRRFSNDTTLPDLVVVDGGKGQLSQAVAILSELNIQGVSVVGLAKARTESDFQATEVKSSQERIFIPNRKNPVPLLPHTAAYKLLTHVRDEAHRFAITYHRLLRGKRSLG